MGILSDKKGKPGTCFGGKGVLIPYRPKPIQYSEEQTHTTVPLTASQQAALAYQTRFGHPVPMWELKNISFGIGSIEELDLRIQLALETGQPIKEWQQPEEPGTY